MPVLDTGIQCSKFHEWFGWIAGTSPAMTKLA